MQLYRLLTAADIEDQFCRKVTRALNDGWELYGSPTMTSDVKSGEVICGQAVVKSQEGDYREDEMLSKQTGKPA
ncbi:MAG: DUF1737 domain-containing protein [Pseudomonadota bacterium]